MKLVDRLLLREEIDALEIDLWRARAREPAAAPSIQAEIDRLEHLIGARSSNSVAADTGGGGP
jgi:hypothetical protein